VIDTVGPPRVPRPAASRSPPVSSRDHPEPPPTRRGPVRPEALSAPKALMPLLSWQLFRTLPEPSVPQPRAATPAKGDDTGAAVSPTPDIGPVPAPGER
jgi:hypothetical protein